MIKLVYAIARRADVPLGDFYDYWLRSHGPRVKGHAEAIGAKRYVQSHTLDTPANEAMRESRGMLPPLPGITEVWWDSLADFQQALSDPRGQAAMADLAEDEAKFIDTANSQIFLTREHPIFDFAGGAKLGPDVGKVTYLLTRRDGMTVEDCHATWLADHGPLVASFARASRMARYVQSHTIAPEINATIGTRRWTASPRSGSSPATRRRLIRKPPAAPAPRSSKTSAGSSRWAARVASSPASTRSSTAGRAREAHPCACLTKSWPKSGTAASPSSRGSSTRRPWRPPGKPCGPSIRARRTTSPTRRSTPSWPTANSPASRSSPTPRGR